MSGRKRSLEINTIPELSYEDYFITAPSLAGLGYGNVLLALLHEATHRQHANIPLPALTSTDLRGS
jgi:hypothetical protein